MGTLIPITDRPRRSWRHREVAEDEEEEPVEAERRSRRLPTKRTRTTWTFPKKNLFRKEAEKRRSQTTQNRSRRRKRGTERKGVRRKRRKKRNRQRRKVAPRSSQAPRRQRNPKPIQAVITTVKGTKKKKSLKAKKAKVILNGSPRRKWEILDPTSRRKNPRGASVNPFTPKTATARATKLGRRERPLSLFKEQENPLKSRQ